SYSVDPRTSAVEGNQVIRLIGSPYTQQHYRAVLKVVLQNKNVMSQYRAVGHPIAFAVTESLLEKAAAELGIDPLELRARNYVPDDAYPYKTLSGYVFEGLSLQGCLAKLREMIGYDALAGQVAGARHLPRDRLRHLRRDHRPRPCLLWRGRCPHLGPGRLLHQARALRQGAAGHQCQRDRPGHRNHHRPGCRHRARRAAGGHPGDHRRYRCHPLWRHRLGVARRGHRQRSRLARGAGAAREHPGGSRRHPTELACRAGPAQWPGGQPRGRRGTHQPRRSGPHRLLPQRHPPPPGFQPQLSVVRHFSPQGLPFAFTNGIHASYVEVDVETGLVRLLRHWVVEDCGRVLDPKLVDEQIRGGVAQGIGMALYEECLYNAEGQLINGSLADYLVPLAPELPDIEVAHMETPSRYSELGAKGAGEAGTAAAPAAIMNAVNDAIAPLGGRSTTMPMTPERILRALKRI